MNKIPSDQLNKEKEHQFVVVLKDGQRLIPKPMKEVDLQKWLSRPLIAFTTRDDTIRFTPKDIKDIEVVME